jgi:long-chain acyl-CoA synthetase
VAMYPGTFAQTAPDRAAVIMASTGQVVTFAQLDEEAMRLAGLLRAAGLGVGDHVAFCIENQSHFHAVAWGCHYAGLLYTAISTRLTAEEMAYIVNDCGARVLIMSAALAAPATELVGDTPDVEVRLLVPSPEAPGAVVPGYDDYLDALAAHPAELPTDAVAGLDMLYSSGTTGRPKGVKLSVASDPLDTPTAVNNLCTLLFGLTDQSVYLSPAPLYHAAPLRFSMAVQQSGATVVVMEHFDPAQALALIERHRVTFSQWVPTMFIRMLKLPEEVRTAHDLSSHEAAVHAAAPCPVEVKAAMIEWWGPILHEYYAGTEGNGFVYTNSTDWLAHPGTVGRNLTGEIHILDDDGEEVVTGEPGTIWFGGTAQFEYHNDPAKTAESRHPKGWTTLGDVGRLDADGFLYLTDRKAYMIISGGVNIYPQEAENLLSMHPKVADVAVIGVPNEDFGEEVKAVVQPADGVDGSPELERELIAYCRQHLADIKCPRSVDFTAELPRHPTGKLYKRLLRDQYWAGHQSSII